MHPTTCSLSHTFHFSDSISVQQIKRRQRDCGHSWKSVEGMTEVATVTMILSPRWTMMCGLVSMHHDARCAACRCGRSEPVAQMAVHTRSYCHTACQNRKRSFPKPTKCQVIVPESSMKGAHILLGISFPLPMRWLDTIVQRVALESVDDGLVVWRPFHLCRFENDK